ncbi:hypothetical protein HDV00_008115 [Rhizophlyctis rosea]|nr:hypothetical protein HDV00_008115 [Rhizophlyctis rosea]
MKLPFAPRFIVCNTPAALEHVLKIKFWNYEKGPIYHSWFAELLGDGIFNADGQHWQMQRKVAARIFTTAGFRTFFMDAFKKNYANLDAILSHAAQSSTPPTLDLQHLLHRYTLDSFISIAFNKSLSTLQSYHTNSTPVPFMTAFDYLQTTAIARSITPLWSWVEWLTGTDKRVREQVEIVDKFAYNFIRQRRRDVDAGRISKDEETDLLGRFMAVVGDDGQPMYNAKQLRDMLSNMVLAGRDTTAQSLSWTIHLIYQHPNVLHTLRQELASLPADPTYDEISHLRYTRAVFREALRLYPQVARNAKMCLSHDVLPDGTRIRKGDMFMWSSYSLGRNTDVWGEDAERFRPERWLEMDKLPSPFEWPAFNGGPRVCLGQAMAVFQANFVLAHIVRDYDIIVGDPMSVTYALNLTLPMKHGYRCTIRKRTDGDGQFHVRPQGV